MKMKTIIRQMPEGGLRVNTLPHDSDSGILHQIFYPELRLGKDFIVGFGFTEKPEELKGRPVITIEGEGDTHECILDAMFLIIGRMCDVMTALIYHKDLDYTAYKQEMDIYNPIMELILKYCTTYHSDAVFVNMNQYNEKFKGEYPYKLLWRADDSNTQVFKLPKERSLTNPEAIATAGSVPVLNIENKFKMSYGAKPSLEEPNSVFYMLMEFNKPCIMLPDAIWAMGQLISYAIDYIPNIIEPNQDARNYASTIFSVLSYDARILVSRKDETNGEN